MGRSIEQRPYPVDKYGFPIPVKELGLFDFTVKDERNNHHMNFFAREFGRLAIAQAFRDLETQQIVMPVTEHNKLHQMFTGIEVPRLTFMLTALEFARERDQQLKVHEPGHGYTHQRITAPMWGVFMKEYNEVGHE